ncbi:MAG: efflux transporter outer membrane subunit [Sandaracinaceae bacterium]|nr:efflux transporter outer membrane subunit [Sandaracinaceae bacterium]
MFKRYVHRPPAALLSLFLLAGCVPALPQGAARHATTTMPASYQGQLDLESAALMDWRELFGDEQLSALVELALENNQELNIAVQENLIASYEVMARRGEIYPSLNAGLGGGVERVSSASSQGASDEQAGLDPNLQGYSLGLYASWEVDIWGRLRNQADAASYRYLASVQGRHFMITELVAEIARLYYELMALDQRLEVVSNTVQIQRSAVDAARLQWQAARTTSLAVTRFQAELLQFQSREYELRQQIVETENRINFLVGRFPQHVDRASDHFMDMQPRTLVAGLPTQLLINRPDIRAAELQLQAADLDVSATRARYFPALSLEAGIGYSSFDILRLVETPGSLFFAVFGNLTAPLLNRTGITADYFSADARQRQAVINYERTILSAYIEVVNRLNLVENLAGSYAVRERRVARLSDSIDISTQLFQSARADYLEVLTARRESLDAQLELIETKQRQLSAVVSLYQALGGGWRRGDDDDSPADAPADDAEDDAGDEAQ